MQIPLRSIAHARSGDKGSGANIGVIAYTPEGYEILARKLTADVVERYFRPMGAAGVVRYELPNLGALNFVLPGILDGGASRTLRVDAQGKALGQVLLEMQIDLTEDEFKSARKS